MDAAHDQRARLGLLAGRAAGAGLLAAAGAIHLDLYLTGYRSIPTIGWLFLAQVIAAFALAIAVLLITSPLAALAGAGFAASTLGGYLLSLWVGLFGFREVRTTAGIVAGVIEIAAFAVLALLAVAEARRTPGPVRMPGSPAATGRSVAGLAPVALVVLGVSVAGAGNAGGPAGSPAATGPSAGPTVVISIRNFAFSPRTPRVSPGERIEVRNDDSVAHTFSAGPAASVASLFGTGDIGPGQVSFVTAPDRVGSYPFYCKIHPFMTGLLLVGGSAPSAAALASLQVSAGTQRSGCGFPPGRLARRPPAVTARRPLPVTAAPSL